MGYYTKIILVIVFGLAWPMVGGFLALAKKDYFSRGFCVTMIAPFAPFFMFFEAPSKAKLGDKVDRHLWPRNGAVAGVCTFLLVIALVIIFG